MQIAKRSWDRYADAHRRVQQAAAEELAEYYDTLPWDADELLAEQLLRQKAVELAERYGVADATLSAGMYDELMEMWGADVPEAEIVGTDPEYVSNDVHRAVSRARTRETARSMSSGAVAGHVKRAGVETMRHNAARDRAMWAWVCIGDSCPFCRALGSRGWQPASRSMVAGNHAEHVHDNCDCQIMVKKPGESLEVEGYDPDALRAEYEAAGGKTSRDAINAMRRADYTPEKAEERNARRRELRALEKSKEVSASIDPELRAWANQFPNEKLWVKQANGELFVREGTPTGVHTTAEEGASFRNGRAKHTHTTSIGGTFGEDDLWFTAETWLSEHEVEDTYHGITYRLTRRAEATEQSAKALAEAYEDMSFAQYDAILGDIYDANGGDKAHGFGPTLDEKIEAESTLKSIQHEWLRERASEWGFDYT